MFNPKINIPSIYNYEELRGASGHYNPQLLATFLHVGEGNICGAVLPLEKTETQGFSVISKPGYR